MAILHFDEHRERAFAGRIARAVAAAIASAALLPISAMGSGDSGVTDLSMAKAEAIGAADITEALAVARGTRIEASAPPTVRLPIFFEFNSTELLPEARTLLEKVGESLSSPELQPYRFSIEGHTDSVGPDAYNRSLSAERAAVVRAFLVARGVPEERLGTTGHGEEMPVASNQTEQGRQRNRRVELINLGAGR